MKFGLAFGGAAAVLLLSMAATAGGLVKVSKAGKGTLKIQGDNLPNVILLTQEVNGDITVTGDKDRFARDTTLKVGNQRPTEATFSGIVTIDIKMKNGDDAVVLDGVSSEPIQLDGDLKIDMGNDDDVVEIETVSVNGGLRLKTGNGRDILDVEGVTVLGKTRMQAGKDDDIFVLLGFSSPKVDIKMDKGDDCIEFDSSMVASGKVDGGNGKTWWDRIGGAGGISAGNKNFQEQTGCPI
jgi:hypothetical protein